MIFAAKETVDRWSRAKDAKAMAKGREVGRKEGIEEGRAEGREKGREEGREQGREEGREQGRREIVALLKEHDIQLPPEVLRRLNGDAE